ncbi:Molybdate-anion transporter [Blyttiomyces sp. JEL0837]|nr:Molybdate-anion transporter [Blyttiomyces sp. JEL0837]
MSSSKEEMKQATNVGFMSVASSEEEQHQKELQDDDPEKGGFRSVTPADVLAFKKSYLFVYSLVMFSDWLQGAYLYPLYKSYGYDLQEIAILFIVGFLASALFALSCVTKFYSNFNILLLGRVLGGVGTSLLFSVFEAWMVSEHKSRGYPDADLSDIFAWSTFANGLMAIAAGVVANNLVDFFGLVSPFAVATAILALTFVFVSGNWAENFGSKDPKNQASLQDGFNTIVKDWRITAVGAMQVLFEGAMYTFVFLWSPTLDHVKGSLETLPFGWIFSSLMFSIMVGSYVFKALIKRSWTEEQIAIVTFGFAAFFILVPFYMRSLGPIIIAFCLFEVACGVYFPVIGTLRSRYIPEATRATIMNIVRFPENIIVVGVLLKVNGDEGDNTSDAYYYVVCCILIAAGAWFATTLRR